VHGAEGFRPDGRQEIRTVVENSRPQVSSTVERLRVSKDNDTSRLKFGRPSVTFVGRSAGARAGRIRQDLFRVTIHPVVVVDF
jgi:hypothetical protein